MEETKEIPEAESEAPAPPPSADIRDLLDTILCEAVSDADLCVEDIPNIDLYLDQILSLVSTKNAEGSLRYQERVLTKTMINNYSKEGLISPVKGKKYTKEQILQMLFIYSLKGTLRIDEIKRVFDALYKDGGFGESGLISLYEDYLKYKEYSRKTVYEIALGARDGLSLEIAEDGDYIRLLFAIVSLSSYLRTVAQTMIDARFPLPEEKSDGEKKAEKQEKKEKEKKEKAEKAEKKEKK